MNALTIDLEDWFHGLDIHPNQWANYEDRLEIGLSVILEALARYRVKATFFVLASLAQNHSRLIRRLINAGHEIGSHGMWHQPVYTQTPIEFAREIRTSIDILQEITGLPVRGHRAAFFSITTKSKWALPLLAEANLAYDSSIFPIYNPRYGIMDASVSIHKLPCGLIEYPVSVVQIGKLNLPFSGGFYARLLPYFVLREAIKRINQQGMPAMIYFHPWEFDPNHPKFLGNVAPVFGFTHYFNLHSTERKLRCLLQDFCFGRVDEVLATQKAVPKNIPY